ncbi:MAG: oligogalacturonate lyase family protein [Pirellulales bacterium]|nr:oligogalacturonate lyase family protein [Pirellulales bacterium]
MSKGRVYPAEGGLERDPATGARVRRVTSFPAIHHHPFYYLPAYDDALRWLVFVSHRTGTPQIFVEERATGRLVQLTDRADLNEWSIHPAHDGQYVYFTAGCGAWRVRCDDQREECLARFGDVPMVPPGMVGDAMGTTSLSHDDRYWAIPVKVGATARLFVLDTSTGHATTLVERDSIGHPEFHPRDNTWLRYAGPYTNRLWVVRRDGTDHRLIYERDAAHKQWIVHEVWNPLALELLTVDWPHGMLGIDVLHGAVRTVCTFNAWHAAVSRDGRWMVCDTNWPDRGLQLFDPRAGGGQSRPLCLTRASNAGEHWHTDHCPYDDGPVAVYAPQHTHPHPNFSPDGSRVVFTSDVSGHAQVYEVLLQDAVTGEEQA